MNSHISIHKVELEIPDRLYYLIGAQAANADHSVEAEIIQTIKDWFDSRE